MACEALRDGITAKLATLQKSLADRSKALGDSFREEAKDIDPDIDTSGPDAWIGADVDISWKTVELSLDLPEVKIVDQEWSLDLPQVTVNDQKIIFDLPGTKMETQKIGEYPEFYCDTSRLIPECTVRWSPIYGDVPVFFTERQEIVIGIPEFRMDRTSVVLGVPEFSMKTVTFSLDLPQITVKNIQVAVSEAKTRGEALAAKSKSSSEQLKKQFAEEAKMAIGFDVNGMFDCYQSEIQKKNNEAMPLFDAGIASIQAAIDSMVAKRIPQDNPAMVQLSTQLVELMKKKNAFVTSITKQYADLDEQRRKFVENILGGAIA